MKKSFVFYLSLIVITIQTSCLSTKDIIMFQESKEDYGLYNISKEAPEHRIKPFDNLYLSVLTLDTEVNQLFNPSLAGTGYNAGTSQMYGDRASQYLNGYRVAADSTISLPIIGNINLVGLTLIEAEKKLKMRAEEFLKEPAVQVKMLNFKVNITGEVRVPGIYYNYEGSISLVDAISMANGITDYADIKNVLVIRQFEDITKTYNVNLTDKSIYTSDVFYLQPSDMVYIPPSKYKRRNENSNTYSQILSTISTILVAVALFLRV